MQFRAVMLPAARPLAADFFRPLRKMLDIERSDHRFRDRAAMPRVLIADKLETAGVELLRDAGIEVETRLGLKGGRLAAALREFDACIVRSQPKITAECLENPGQAPGHRPGRRRRR